MNTDEPVVLQESLYQESFIKSRKTSEFVEVAIHNILYTRKLYDTRVFERRKKYGIPVYRSIHPDLNSYIEDTLKYAFSHGKLGFLQSAVLCVKHDTEILENYVFDVNILQNIDHSDPVYYNLEQHFRSLLLRLSSVEKYLKVLPIGAEFCIQLRIPHKSFQSENETSIPIHNWICVDEQLEHITQEIIPIYTVNAKCLNLQLYQISISSKSEQSDQNIV